ncbi:enoyl-CoA hydratase/isomerase family protein [Leucobacter sp. CSA1]|uniref:Enoyl-CoA hydratase/isomerase family protein n=1 Tax=Leucobacter chromiisoli TaxID=2796471 RepID=A0A934UVB3_9MICO|nr:enoyl-CoA hydratase/isomerase family protein [Leucobacter chromiisoli]MBK0419043.1 enoyl-CoA hydratase/isomerase family protein [Leucobacter chromiisoli]
MRVLTISNPAKRNAFSGSMAPDLRDRLTEADRDPSVRCIVITGDGTQSFSSGHDLAEVLENPETAGDPEANAAFVLAPSLGTPVVGAINGNAYAAGFILALNCDVRIAGTNARFCAVGAKIGLVPVGGQLSRLLHLVGYPVAFRMLATGLPVDAEYALACQFVDQICDPEETVDRAVELATRISEASPSVVRAVKTGLSATIAHGAVTGQRIEPLLAAAVRELPDGGEGVASFLEKRPAEYPDAPARLQAQLDAVVAGTIGKSEGDR